MMKGNINLISYDCYQQATEKQLAGLKWKENRVYYISEIHNEKMQDEIYGYIDDRCRRLSLSTAVNDIYRFDLLKEFLNEKCTSCSSITDKKWEELERSYKAFLYKKGLALYVRRNRPDRRNVEQQSSAQISFLKMYYEYVVKCKTADIPENEKDVWDMRKLDIVPRSNPIRGRYRLDFREIRQKEFKEIIKKILYSHCQTKAMGSIKGELRGFRRFASFMYDRFPEVKHFTEISRDMIEDYLVYIKTDTGLTSGRMKIPFGIAQIGKAFRNEIVARQFIFRMREFEQMEMQFFVKPGTELDWFKTWKETRLKWHKALGFGDDHYRYHDHDKLAHYANAATDIEFLMPFGFKEVEGIHSRTNFDLSQHEKFSGKNIKYFDPETNESYTPYVIETSIGVDRMFLSIMSASYCEEQLENGETRVVLKLPAALAPVKLAVMPLVKKDGLPEKAREIIDNLKFHFHCQYDEKDSIGKRYRRQDAIGTPYCVTVDHQTLEDNCVTLRNRDTMQQERVAISELNNIIADRVSITSLLKTLQ